MATITRQPFAPIHGVRLQALTSTKNRQNAMHSPAAKRKALSWTEADDSENVDPNLFAKRCKGSGGSAPMNGTIKKPAFTFTKASFDVVPAAKALDSGKPAAVSSKPRALLKPRAPSTRADIKASAAGKSPMRLSPLSTSPNRSSIRAPRRAGILTNKRRAGSSVSCTSLGSSNFGSAAPFSLDAALKGTFSSLESRLTSSALGSSANTFLDDSGMSSSWFFDIHEDTPEQEMTNLLQHSTCVLDISSDEESEQKLRREKAEGRDKENIPPPNDVSQTSSARTEAVDDMAVEKSRDPLSQLNAADYYADGCNEASVVLVPSDEPEQPADIDTVVARLVETDALGQPESAPLQPETKQGVAETVSKRKEDKSVENIMTGRDGPVSSAALLEPIEGTGESFQLWESGSQKDDEL